MAWWSCLALELTLPLLSVVQDIWECPKIRGTLFGGPYNKDCSILGLY